jgi:hypothetical protein
MRFTINQKGDDHNEENSFAGAVFGCGWDGGERLR